MKNVIFFEVKRQIRALSIWSLIISSIIILLMCFFPLLQNSSMQDVMKAKMDAMPESMKKSFDMDLFTDFSSVINYFSSVFQNALMAICIFATMYGTNSLIKEEGDGTIEFLYGQPISRKAILTSKLVANLILFAILITITGIVSVVVCLIFSPENADYVKLFFQLKNLLIAGFISGLVYMSVGTLLSSLIKNPSQSTGVFFALFFLTYIGGVASKMVEEISFIKYFSPFQYADPATIVKQGYDATYVAISVGLILISILLSYKIYSRKDLKV